MTMQAKEKRWNQFYGLIAGGEESASTRKKELQALGVDVSRVELAICNIVAQGRSRAREGWLERARYAQSQFERAYRSKKEWLSKEYGNTQELVAAISLGRFGNGLQQQAHVFFRNQDLSQTSEMDLRSFLDDCELLGLFEGNFEAPKK